MGVAEKKTTDMLEKYIESDSDSDDDDVVGLLGLLLLLDGLAEAAAMVNKKLKYFFYCKLVVQALTKSKCIHFTFYIIRSGLLRLNIRDYECLGCVGVYHFLTKLHENSIICLL